MEKARKLKEVQLTCTKLEVKAGEDWRSPVAEGLPMGLYLGETPEGGIFLFSVNEFGDRNGMWLPLGEIIKFNVDKEQMSFVSALLEFEGRLKKVEDLANDNNIILNELEDGAKENAVTIAHSLVNIEKQIKELPKHTESQKSSLTEMGEVVVNIIKATK